MITISKYLIEKLRLAGVDHVFGIPGTSCASFFDSLLKDGTIKPIITTSELEAGYAADGYGRHNSAGAVCVTYGVGTLSLVNAVASAFTERVPLIVINGGPTEKDILVQKEKGILFSHSTGRESTDLKVFTQICAYAKRIDNIVVAKQVIDEAFMSMSSNSRPVYIEIPSDLWLAEITFDEQQKSPVGADQHTSISPEFLRDVKKRLSRAKAPVLFIGSEIQRRALLQPVLQIAERWNIPFVTTPLTKTYLTEEHPNFIGCYDSDLFHKTHFKVVDDSDCIISLGCIWGIDHGAFVLAKFDNMIDVGWGKCRIGGKVYPDCHTSLMLDRFAEIEFRVNAQLPRQEVADEEIVFNSITLNHELIFKSIGHFFGVKREILIAADTFLGSFPAADLFLKGFQTYLANPIWLSIGQATPASIGASLKTGKKAVVVTGDGGFQMVSSSFSTMVKYDITTLIVIVDNGMYGIEQYLLDKSFFEGKAQALEYVNIAPWKYEQLPAAYGGGVGVRVRNVAELETAFSDWLHKPAPTILVCEVPAIDLPN